MTIVLGLIGINYFHLGPRDTSLPAVLPRLLEIAQALDTRPESGLRLHAVALRQALSRFGEVLAGQFRKRSWKYRRDPAVLRH
jgi:hypothetical protein